MEVFFLEGTAGRIRRGFTLCQGGPWKKGAKWFEIMCVLCVRHVSMYWCVGADWGRGLKSMGFWMSVANVGGIFGVKEDEQVGMSWKLGWNFCSNETTGDQARKDMACITVGDWRLRLIQLRNRFERIIFFRIWTRVSQLFPPQDGVSAAKLLKEAWVAGGEHPTARSVAWPSSPRCRLNSGRRGRTSRFFIFERLLAYLILIEAIVALYDEVTERFLGTIGREGSSTQFCCLTWWMYMFWSCSCSNAGVLPAEVAGHSRWSSLVALLPGVSPAKVATGQGLKCVGCSCQMVGALIVFSWRKYLLENIRTAFHTMILNDTSLLSLNRGFRYSILSGPTWLMRPGWAEQEPFLQTKGPRGRDPSPAPGEQGHARGRFLVSLTEPTSRGWEFSLGPFFFLPWMLRTGCPRHPDAAAEEEEVAAPGRSTIKNLLGCGNESML